MQAKTRRGSLSLVLHVSLSRCHAFFRRWRPDYVEHVWDYGCGVHGRHLCTWHMWWGPMRISAVTTALVVHSYGGSTPVVAVMDMWLQLHASGKKPIHVTAVWLSQLWCYFGQFTTHRSFGHGGYGLLSTIGRRITTCLHCLSVAMPLMRRPLFRFTDPSGCIYGGDQPVSGRCGFKTCGRVTCEVKTG